MLYFIILIYICIFIPILYKAFFYINNLSNVEKNTKIDLTKLKIDVSPDNLPEVKFDFELNLNEGNNDIDEESKKNIDNHYACITKGLYLGKNDLYESCIDKCNIEDPNSIKYKFVQPLENIYVQGKKIESGAYCLPTDAAICNTSTSNLVFSNNGWLCLNRIKDYFGGEGGSRIQICDNRILDKATNTIYENNLPSNLTFTDFINDKLSDGETFRFDCVPDARNSAGINMIASNFDRFKTIPNFCISSIPNIPFEDSKKILPNFNADNKDSICKNCSDLNNWSKWLGESSFEGSCNACRLYVNSNYLTNIPSSIPCYYLTDPLDFVKQIIKVNPLTMPCGFVNTDKGLEEQTTRPRCNEIKISAFAGAVPSHKHLQLY